jgi:hypothetical protein
VLKPDAPYAAEYETKDWEKHIEKTPAVIDTAKSGILPHELMLGVTISGESKAYPVRSMHTAKLIEDTVACTPILILEGPDQASIRVFHARLDEEPMTFVSMRHIGQANKDGVMQDTETASIWNFQGCAISGILAGRCLTPTDAIKDYWFDWMNHHPKTAIFMN